MIGSGSERRRVLDIINKRHESRIQTREVKGTVIDEALKRSHIDPVLYKLLLRYHILVNLVKDGRGSDAMWC